MPVTDNIFGTTIQFPTRPEDWQPALDARSESIFEQQSLLASVLDNYSTPLRNRWDRKQKTKRAEVFQGAYQGKLPKNHRADFREFLRVVGNQIDAEPTSYDLFLCPQLNLEDLLRPRSLSIFLEARARHHPRDFISPDIENMRLAIEIGLVPNTDYNHEAREYVGFRRSEQWQGFAKWFPSGMYPLPSSGDLLVIDSRVALVGLEAQRRILVFLVNCVRRILHDIDLDTLPRQQILFAQPTTEEAMDDPDFATYNVEAMFRAPSSVNLGYLVPYVKSQAFKLRDEFTALRQDPSYYVQYMREAMQQPSEFGQDHVVMADAISWTIRTLHTWDNLQQEAEWWLRIGTGPLRNWDNGVLTESDDGRHTVVSTEYLAIGKQLARSAKRLEIHTNRLIQLLKTLAGEPSEHDVLPLELALAGESSATDSSTSNKLANLLTDSLTAPEKSIKLIATGFSLLMRSTSRCGPTILAELHYWVQHGPGKKLRPGSRIRLVISELFLCAALRRQYDVIAQWWKHIPLTNFPFISLDTYGLSEEFSITDDAAKAFRPVIKKMGRIDSRRFAYPCDKRRTQQNVELMQQAERNLEALWAALFYEFQLQDPLLLCWTIHNDFRDGEDAYHTPDWQEDEEEAVESLPAQEDLHTVQQTLSDLQFELEYRTQRTLEPERARVRGVRPANLERPAGQPPQAPPQLPPPPEEPPQPPAPMAVDRRAMKAFHTMFFVQRAYSRGGELPWTDFLHAMNSAGFQAQQLQGSAWHFFQAPSKNMRGINFHGPHPNDKLRNYLARYYGRRLRHAYGWTAESFALAPKKTDTAPEAAEG